MLGGFYHLFSFHWLLLKFISWVIFKTQQKVLGDWSMYHDTLLLLLIY